MFCDQTVDHKTRPFCGLKLLPSPIFLLRPRSGLCLRIVEHTAFLGPSKRQMRLGDYRVQLYKLQLLGNGVFSFAQSNSKHREFSWLLQVYGFSGVGDLCPVYLHGWAVGGQGIHFFGFPSSVICFWHGVWTKTWSASSFNSNRSPVIVGLEDEGSLVVDVWHSAGLVLQTTNAMILVPHRSQTTQKTWAWLPYYFSFLFLDTAIFKGFQATIFIEVASAQN